jgi:UDP-N-acetylglucosamine 2-epimerase (non-hydrolysing)
MKLTLVAGARPNFMKIAPIIHSILNARKVGEDFEFRLIHTGQHYDKSLSENFFEDLEIPSPNLNLEVGSGTHAEQTGEIMLGFERELVSHPTDLVIVVGDVNSTLACSIVAKKSGIKVTHVEAGIRSGDWSMPEEINRKVTDSICDYFFTTSRTASDKLIEEGHNPDSIFFVGNTMIDTLVNNRERFRAPNLFELPEKYLLLTMHRPSNVDDEESLKRVFNLIVQGAKGIIIIFPVHPRTKKSMRNIHLPNQFLCVDPVRYFEFMFLVENSIGVITDSGGIQEETSYLGVPCLTLRENTERPETVEIGTNHLIGKKWDSIPELIEDMILGKWKKGIIPELWDGKTAKRIIKILPTLDL